MVSKTVLLGHKNGYFRKMKQSREPRNKSTHLQVIYISTKIPRTQEKTSFFNKQC